ncbi:MAG: hypothetical protein JNM68_07675 [Dinghuibacter sp.]|nr:hypothetical protein [Dinghuibacter sp.]
MKKNQKKLKLTKSTVIVLKPAGMLKGGATAKCTQETRPLISCEISCGPTRYC